MKLMKKTFRWEWLNQIRCTNKKPSKLEQINTDKGRSFRESSLNELAKFPTTYLQSSENLNGPFNHPEAKSVYERH